MTNKHDPVVETATRMILDMAYVAPEIEVRYARTKAIAIMEMGATHQYNSRAHGQNVLHIENDQLRQKIHAIEKLCEDVLNDLATLTTSKIIDILAIAANEESQDDVE